MSGMVIVGGGQAGFSAAYKLRSIGFQGPISILCSEKYLPYQRPPLSKKFLMGEMLEERLLFKPSRFYEENDLSIR